MYHGGPALYYKSSQSERRNPHLKPLPALKYYQTHLILIFLFVERTISHFMAGFRETSPDTPALGQVPRRCDAKLSKQRTSSLIRAVCNV
jgi:hypothetical protein